METLGSEEVSKGKILFIIIYLFVYAFLFYATIGATTAQKDLLYFYMFFGLVIGIIPILFDLAVKKEAPMDTVTVEDEDEALFSISHKFQLFLGIIISIGIGLWMFNSGQAFVQAPRFSIFDTPVGNSVVSAVVGGFIETIVFFSFIYPTLHSVTHHFTGSIPIAILVSIVLTTIIFTGYHNWRYAYDERALMSVATFGILNCLLVLIFRSVIINIQLHFVNNFLVSLLELTKMMFSIVI